MKVRNTSLPILLISAICLLVPVPAMGQCAAPSFRSAIRIDAGPLPVDIAAGDLNSDGRTDFVIPNFSTDEVYVVLASSIGGPTVSKLISVLEPSAAGIADFNHDGKLDLAISRDTFGAKGVSILLGDGTGGFGSPTKFPSFNVKPLIVADFNNDNNPDVFLGNTNGGVSQLLLGNGTGGLSGGSSFNAQGNSEAVAADLNNDGKLDLALVNDVSSVIVVLGDGTGNFSDPKNFTVSRARFLAVADFNNDNKLDVVTAGQLNGISLLLGDGAGNLGAATSFSLGLEVATLAAGDFNADGKPDVFLSADQSKAAILAGNGSGGFGAPTVYNTNTSAIDLVVGDFDGDGKVDVATADSSNPSGTASIFFGDGAGKLRFPTVLPVGLSPHSITNGDLNNDGHNDLAYANISHNSVTILIGDGNGGFGPATNFAVGSQPRSVVLGDLNGDQKLDLVTANFDARTVTVLLGDGQGSFGPASHINVPGFNPHYAAIGDMNNDERPDLVVAYFSDSSVSILVGNGDGTFGQPTSFTIPIGGKDIAINDLNLDGVPDLVIATNSGVTFMLGKVGGGFLLTGTIITGASVGAVVVDDFNGDGKVDIAGLISNNRVDIFRGDGQGNFNESEHVPATVGANFLRAADFNGDGNTDLATSNHLGTASIMLGNGSGAFAPPVAYYTGGGFVIRTITAADFNSDGRPDVAITDQSGSVSVIFNSCSATPVTVPTLSISNVTVNEEDTGSVNAVFNVSLSAASSKTVVVAFYVQARAAAGVLTFAPGVTTQTITLPVPGDVLDEFDEQFNVRLVFPLNAVIAVGQAQLTILDNDPPPTISINNVTVNEGNASTTFAVFTVSLSAPSGKPISVSVTTSDSLAEAGSDYQSNTQTLNFAPGQTSLPFAVTVLGDNVNERDENFLVTLSNPANVTIANAQGLCTIVNDDLLHLILDESGPTSNKAAALDSVLMLREPFQLQIPDFLNFGPDRRTRVMVFATNLQLNQGEAASSVVVNLVGSNNQSFDVPAEDVRALPNTDFTQVVFPLPSDLSAGLCTVTLKAQGKISNSRTITIAP